MHSALWVNACLMGPTITREKREDVTKGIILTYSSQIECIVDISNDAELAFLTGSVKSYRQCGHSLAAIALPHVCPLSIISPYWAHSLRRAVHFWAGNAIVLVECINLIIIKCKTRATFLTMASPVRSLSAHARKPASQHQLRTLCMPRVVHFGLFKTMSPIQIGRFLITHRSRARVAHFAVNR